MTLVVIRRGKEPRKKIIYAPPPPSPHFGQKAFFREGVCVCVWGVCVYIYIYVLKPPSDRNFIPPPLFYTPPLLPPLLEGYFQGWGVGCINLALCSGTPNPPTVSSWDLISSRDNRRMKQVQCGKLGLQLENPCTCCPFWEASRPEGILDSPSKPLKNLPLIL